MDLDIMYFSFSHKKLETMETVYGLSQVQNSEIRFRWIRLGLLAKWESAVPRAVQMVTEQGRMKFLRPLYR
jgi:leukotriene-A4 hydrolase